jgi:membrane-associated protein
MLTALFHIDPITFLKTAGYLGLTAIVFAESGILLGIFLPGDSLLFAAGLLASQGLLHILLVMGLCIVAAIIGDSIGYYIGSSTGHALFNRPQSRFIKKSYLDRTELFYQKHGARAVVVARFVPVVRTLAPFFAGIGTMRYGTFFKYNIIGGVLWGAGMPLVGYTIGSAFPITEHYLLPISIGIIVVSFIPVAIEYFGARSNNSK